MYDLLDKIIAYETGELSVGETVKLFAHLVQTGQAWTLQGFYGRGAYSLIEQGIITREGEITEYGETFLEEVEDAEQ